MIPTEIIKDKNEAYSVVVDYNNKLPTGATIVSAVLSALDKDLASASDTVLDGTTATVTTTSVTVDLKAGGIQGASYKVIVTATLSPSGTLIDSFMLRLREQ